MGGANIQFAASAAGRKVVAGISVGNVYTSSDFDDTWHNRSFGVASGNNYWYSIASSTDGVNLAAISTKAGSPKKLIFTSVNSGVTWIDQTPQSGAGTGNLEWKNIASSADGRLLVAVASNEYIYQSTDYGKSWKNISTGDASGQLPWLKVASSADGQKLVAITEGSFPGRSHLFTSGIGGGSWKDQSPIKNDIPKTGFYLLSVSCSSDCNYLVSIGQYMTTNASGQIISIAKVFTSDNFGTTWTERPIPKGSDPDFISKLMSTKDAFQAIAASSADGSRIAILVTGPGTPSSLLLTSSSYGKTWTEQPMYPLQKDVQWAGMYELASSSDGKVLTFAGGEKTDSWSLPIQRWRMLSLTLP